VGEKRKNRWEKKYEEENKVGEWRRIQKYIKKTKKMEEREKIKEKKKGGGGKNTPYFQPNLNNQVSIVI
jgi:hypothetical protein